MKSINKIVILKHLVIMMKIFNIKNLKRISNKNKIFKEKISIIYILIKLEFKMENQKEIKLYMI